MWVLSSSSCSWRYDNRLALDLAEHDRATRNGPLPSFGRSGAVVDGTQRCTSRGRFRTRRPKSGDSSPWRTHPPRLAGRADRGAHRRSCNLLQAHDSCRPAHHRYPKHAGKSSRSPINRLRIRLGAQSVLASALVTGSGSGTHRRSPAGLLVAVALPRVAVGDRLDPHWQAVDLAGVLDSAARGLLFCWVQVEGVGPLARDSAGLVVWVVHTGEPGQPGPGTRPRHNGTASTAVGSPALGRSSPWPARR